jgi:hypothetical protein
VAQVELINPTPIPTPEATNTPTPTNTATPSATPTLTPTIPPTVEATPPEEPGVRIELSEFWMLTAVSIGLILVSSVTIIVGRQQAISLENQVGALTWGIAGGLLFYLYYVIGLPGTAVLENLNTFAGLITTFSGGVFGLLLYRFLHKPSQSH